MADLLVFNQDHGGRQSIEQDIEAIVRLNQVGIQGLDLEAQGGILLLERLRGLYKKFKGASQFAGLGR